jgi:hypothetical protein
MGRIQRQHHAIRALVAQRRIKLTQLTLTRSEAVAAFRVSRQELLEALRSGMLGYNRQADAESIPAWRLARLFPAR